MNFAERSPIRKKQFGISVSDKVYETVSDHAKKMGYSPTGYAVMLFEAAFAARFGNSGDAELDHIVAGTLILHGCGIDFPAIAKLLGTPEQTVERIVSAWMSRASEAIEQ